MTTAAPASRSHPGKVGFGQRRAALRVRTEHLKGLKQVLGSVSPAFGEGAPERSGNLFLKKVVCHDTQPSEAREWLSRDLAPFQHRKVNGPDDQARSHCEIN
jgi:hypothetical protein